ncbi:MAG: hypothetical protein HEQ38_09085 [Gemmatimonas sp.]|nr:hypothetical protein [Gemmatimonas sp.]
MRGSTAASSACVAALRRASAAFTAKSCGSHTGSALTGHVDRPFDLGDVLRVGLAGARRLLAPVIERGIGEGGGLTLARGGSGYRFARRTNRGIEAEGGGAGIRERETLLGPERRCDETQRHEDSGL